MQLHLRVFHNMWIKNREAPLYLVVWIPVRQVIARVGVSRRKATKEPHDYAEVSPLGRVVRVQMMAKMAKKIIKNLQHVAHESLDDHKMCRFRVKLDP
jgi:hypothetical protein